MVLEFVNLFKQPEDNWIFSCAIWSSSVWSNAL